MNFCYGAARLTHPPTWVVLLGVLVFWIFCLFIIIIIITIWGGRGVGDKHNTTQHNLHNLDAVSPCVPFDVCLPS